MFGVSVLVTVSNRLTLTKSVAKLTKEATRCIHAVSIDNAKN